MPFENRFGPTDRRGFCPVDDGRNEDFGRSRGTLSNVLDKLCMLRA